MSQPAASGLFTIGQVLAALQHEFPDLTGSKLRFLEDEGLISPARTAAGYRKYSSADIERVATVLSMQRDLYLPLRVIRAHFESVETAGAAALPSATGAAMRVARPRMRRADLISAAGATPQLLDDAIATGFLVAEDTYPDQAVSVLAAFVTLRSVGVEPRHLTALRAAAARDINLLERAVGPTKRSDAAAAARRQEQLHELSEALETVYAQALRRTLERSTG